MHGIEVWGGFTSRTFEFKPNILLSLNPNHLRMSFCDICQYKYHQTMTQEESEFQGGGIHSEELSASLAFRDETTDLGLVPIAPFLTIVSKQTLDVLGFSKLL